jgi:hypothetical protein
LKIENDCSSSELAKIRGVASIWRTGAKLGT